MSTFIQPPTWPVPKTSPPFTSADFPTLSESLLLGKIKSGSFIPAGNQSGSCHREERSNHQHNAGNFNPEQINRLGEVDERRELEIFYKLLLDEVTDDEKYLTQRMNRALRRRLERAYRPPRPRETPVNRTTSTRRTSTPVVPPNRTTSTRRTSIPVVPQSDPIIDYQAWTIDDYQQASHGLSPARIAMFQTFEADESMNDKKCVICQLNFGEEDPITKVVDKSVMKLRLKEDLDGFKEDERNCNHVFHVECITGWFRCATTCPLCKIDKQ